MIDAMDPLRVFSEACRKELLAHGAALRGAGAPDRHGEAGRGATAEFRADVLLQRSEQFYAEKAEQVPHVLGFDADVVLDGRIFEQALAGPRYQRRAVASADCSAGGAGHAG